jgi:hypothetical protein
MFAAADLQEELAEQRFSVPKLRRRRLQPSEHRSERQRAIQQSAMRE